MKVIIKTEHGRFVAKLPDDKTFNIEGLAKAAAFLDKLGSESNAGTAKVTYRSPSDHKIVTTLTWLPDDIADDIEEP